MAFEPKTWACGDTITAQELNRMEQGIAEAGQGGELKYVKDDSSDNGGVIEGLVSDSLSSESINIASGQNAHAEGGYSYEIDENINYEPTKALGTASHAEGAATTASGECSHAEGMYTTASDRSSHAEGDGTTASNYCSHAEGGLTTASGDSSHAEGSHTVASGTGSHAEGMYTTANHKSQHVFGEYNVADPSTAQTYNRGTYVEIVGNGTKNNNRSNARTLDWSGNEVLQGSLTLGKGTADETTVTATQLKALLALLNS